MRAFLSLALVLALAGPVGAEHCTTWSTSTSGAWGPFVEAGGHYVFTDCWTYDPECNLSFWIYEESNGIPGLQREDETHDDTCHGIIPGDRIVL
jgi:hypothetical protein